MSVYKPPKSPYFHYDFTYKGDRHYGSTGQKTRAKAEGVERAKREAVALEKARGVKAVGQAVPTLDEAAGEWWQFKGQALGKLSNEKERMDRLSAAVEFIGKNKLVTDIRTADIAEAMRKRRGKLVKNTGRVPANRTVNHEIIDTIRPVLRRAFDLMDLGNPAINWASCRLPERKPKPRDFQSADLGRLISDLPSWWQDFARLQSRYGFRLGEMFFKPGDIDPERRELRLRDRKGDDDHIMPLADDDSAMLAARKGRAEAAGLDTVWFRELRSGKLKALRYNGAKQALRRVMRTTGLHASQNAKGSHDLRRHAAISMLRSSDNTRTAQRLLGHSDIKSTMVYADVSSADLRAAIDALSRNCAEPLDTSNEKDDNKQTDVG